MTGALPATDEPLANPAGTQVAPAVPIDGASPQQVIPLGVAPPDVNKDIVSAGTNSPLPPEVPAETSDAIPPAALVRALFRPAGAPPRALGGAARDMADVLKMVDARVGELSPDARAPARALIRELAEDLKFFSKMNEFIPVAQIPLALADGPRTTASIYVWNDAEDGGRRADPKNATVFLSLFTAHMGRVEALCKVAGPSVECDFRAPAGGGAAALRGGGNDLAKLLEAHGFQLRRFTAAESGRPSDLIDAAEHRAVVAPRYSFDRTV